MSPLVSKHLALLIVFLVVRPGITVSCRFEEYRWSIGGVEGCCAKCRAGYYLRKRCENFNDIADCRQCPSGKYSKDWNTYSSCAQCRTCPKEIGTTYKKNCSTTSNAECLCGKDKQWNTDLNSCMPCQPGFYSDGDEKPCKNRTDGIPTTRTTITQGRTASNSTTVPSATLLNTSTGPLSSVTEGQPALSIEVKFYISVITVAAVIFLIFLIKRGKMNLGVKKQGFHRCFGIKQDVKGPVQEVSEDITSVQVKN
ncbi:tumor necrosis factor receptor superfamily member 4-like [Carcharodon carcharias]|uniref:tumor necrosis factor receptor superfamily member 4-like n=1 Tax=Carcharodon carcharias TaxID=13397 RepID=UPI001B7F281C|nr:tumor necrosis factor receptor superfamily member 4-like [Carcharodon carcharias]